MPNGELHVRIFYPLQEGRIVLRTSDRWDVDVEANATSPDRQRFDFRVPTGEPYLYFKPCIVDSHGFHWSIGSNYLGVTAAAEPRDVYPHFYGGSSGSISGPLTLGGHRVRIYQPPGYAENHLKRYPVLYMHDGQNLFFPDEAFMGQEWRVDETLDLLDSMSAIDKVIVVGVYPRDRMNEYTRPGYEEYGRFVVHELKHTVDAELRTLPGPQTTAVMGSSLGGVVSLYLAWQWPEVFGRAACLSSTFGWRDDLLQRVAGEPKRNVKVYLDSGWPGDNYEVTRSMRDLLLRGGFRSGVDLLGFVFPGAAHSEVHWSTRVHLPFQFFFGKVPDLAP